jgi:hypothetical protein
VRVGSVVAVLAALIPAIRAGAAVTLTVSRPELLYSQSADPDCSALHGLDDPDLPFNVVRLTANVDGGPFPKGLAYHWSIPKAAEGLLAADLDLGPGAQNFALAGMCAEFGNECVLTEGRARFYNEPTVFFVAPTCAVLPKTTERAFHGGATKVKLKVKSGKRTVGKVAAKIGWGRSGQIVLFAQGFNGRFDDGIGEPNGVHVPAITPAAARVTEHPNPEPAGGIQTYFFDGEAFNTVGVDGCADPALAAQGFDACGVEIILKEKGHAFPTVEARYDDGSALCDILEVRAGPCSPRAKLDVIPRPRRPVYDPADPARSVVDLTVRLRNESRPENGLPACTFLLRGANVLSCTSKITVGGIEELLNTRFDLKHCSVTTDQGCLGNADCAAPRCGTCQEGEVCLTQSHCSESLGRPCQTDRDCRASGQNPPCPNCQPKETCVHVIDVPAADILIPPGQFFDLVHDTKTMQNVLPDVANVADTWTANIFLPEASADAKLRYKIRGRPRPTP